MKYIFITLFIITFISSNHTLAVQTTCSFDSIPKTTHVLLKNESTSQCSGQTYFYDTPDEDVAVCSSWWSNPGVMTPLGWYVTSSAGSFDGCNSPANYLAEFSDITGSKTGILCDGLGIGVKISNGIVVTKVESDTRCSSNNTNKTQLRLKQATSGGDVCEQTPDKFANGQSFPTGWFVIDNTQNPGSDCTGRKLTIVSNPSPNQKICGNATGALPSGYVYSGTTTTSKCSGPAYLVGTATDGATVCGTNSAPPQNFVTVAQNVPVSQCSAGSGYTIRSTSNITGTGLDACYNDSNYLPDGFIISEVYSSTQNCSINRVRVRQPANGLTMCPLFGPLPQGYAITETGTSALCTKSGNAPYQKISTLVSGNTYCDAELNLPNGWAVTNVTSATNCPTNRITLTDLTTLNDNHVYICSDGTDLADSLATTGYTVYGDSEVDNNLCGTARNRYLISKLENGNATVCSDIPVPEGWVVTGKVESSVCSGSGFNAKTIAEPDPEGTTVCKDSPIPPNYLVESEVSASCGNENKGYRISVPDTNAPGTFQTCSGPCDANGDPINIGDTTCYDSTVFFTISQGMSDLCGPNSTFYLLSTSNIFVLPAILDAPTEDENPESITYDCGGNDGTGFATKSRNFACN